METEYAAVPCDSLIPAFSFPTEYKIDKKIYGTPVHFNCRDAQKNMSYDA